MMVWGRHYDAESLEDLVERWGVTMFVLGHEKVPEGARFVAPCAVVLNSDHVLRLIEQETVPAADDAEPVVPTPQEIADRFDRVRSDLEARIQVVLGNIVTGDPADVAVTVSMLSDMPLVGASTSSAGFGGGGGMVIRLDVESRTALESAPAESALMGDVDAVMSAGPLSEPAPTSDALLRRLVPAGSSEIQN